jgi:hypothetical protein
MSLEWKANVFLFTMWTISSLYKSVYSNSTTFNRYIYIVHSIYQTVQYSPVLYVHVEKYLSAWIPLQSIPVYGTLLQGNGWHYRVDIYIFSISLFLFLSSRVVYYASSGSRTGHVWPRPWNSILFCIIDPSSFSSSSLLLQF